MANQSTALEAGKIKFYDRFDPVIVGGNYTVELVHEVFDENSQPVFAETKSQKLLIAPPRLRLGPRDVHAVYPPPGGESNYSRTLPHIVLRRRGLPWERNLGIYTDKQGQQHTRPWLALLLFTAEEVESEKIQPQKRPAAQIAGGTAGFGIDGRTLLPQFAAAEIGEGENEGRTIDVPKALFDKIGPRLDDLPFLAHVREVNTGDKEILGLEEKGFFSVVIGNRLPNPPNTGFQGQHIAHLVSLAGWQPFLEKRQAFLDNGTPLNLPDFTHLRLVTLATWTFSNRGDGGRGSFEGHMKRLSSGLLRALPPDAPGPAPDSGEEDEASTLTPAEQVQRALGLGYVPLNYTTRFGEPSIAWYRGPLLPAPTIRRLRHPFASGEAGLIYDETTGLFDVSLGVAWQLGRMLALSDPTFAAALGRWWRKGVNVEDVYQDRVEFFERYQNLLAAELGPSSPSRNGNGEVEEQRAAELATILEEFRPDELSRAVAGLILDQGDNPGLIRLIADRRLFGESSARATGIAVPELSDSERELLLHLSPAQQVQWLLERIRQQRLQSGG